MLWGIEDSRNLSARLERDLLSAGQKVVRVATKLMAQARKFARTRGKSDPIDALDDSVAVGPLVPTATGSAPVTRSPDRADPLAPTRRFPSRASSRSRTRPAASAEPRQVSRTRTRRARRRAPCTCGCRPWAARPSAPACSPAHAVQSIHHDSAVRLAACIQSSALVGLSSLERNHALGPGGLTIPAMCPPLLSTNRVAPDNSPVVLYADCHGTMWSFFALTM